MPTEKGFCECGCGQRTKLHTVNADELRQRVEELTSALNRAPAGTGASR